VSFANANNNTSKKTRQEDKPTDKTGEILKIKMISSVYYNITIVITMIIVMATILSSSCQCEGFSLFQSQPSTRVHVQQRHQQQQQQSWIARGITTNSARTSSSSSSDLTMIFGRGGGGGGNSNNNDDETFIPGKKMNVGRRKKLGINDDEEEYDLEMALNNSTDPFITKVIAGSLIISITTLLIYAIVIPATTDYGDGVCNALLTGGRC